MDKETQQLKQENENLQRQVLKSKEQVQLALDRTRYALYHIRKASAYLCASECNLAGNPEPKQGE